MWQVAADTAGHGRVGSELRAETGGRRGGAVLFWWYSGVFWVPSLSVDTRSLRQTLLLLLLLATGTPERDWLTD